MNLKIEHARLIFVQLKWLCLMFHLYSLLLFLLYLMENIFLVKLLTWVLGTQ